MTRIKINNHLDKLQADLTKQLYLIEEKENANIFQLLASVEKTQKEIKECQSKIGNMKKHTTDLLMFLSMKQIEKDVDSKDKFLQALNVEGDNLKQNSLSYEIHNSIQNIISSTISFGEVRMETKSCNILMIKKKIKQAQMVVPTTQSKSIESIRLVIHKTINTQLTAIYGCCMLPDGRMAFSYISDKTFKVFSKKGSIKFEVKMPCGPFDMCTTVWTIH